MLKFAAKNPNDYSLEDVRKGVKLIFGEHIERIRKIGYNISGQVGICPIWHDNETDKDCKDRANQHAPKCECLHIHKWNEMIELLENLIA